MDGQDKILKKREGKMVKATDIDTRQDKHPIDRRPKNKKTDSKDMFTLMAEMKQKTRGKNPEWEYFIESLNRLTADNVHDLAGRLKDRLNAKLKRDQEDGVEQKSIDFFKDC